MKISNMADNNRALTYTEMREQNLFTDAVVKSSSGREWPVHRVVVSRAGRFFSNAFKFSSFSGTLDLGVSDDLVQVILDLAYRGTCQVDVENVLEILSAAFMYQMESLIEICATIVLNNMINSEHVLALKVFVRDHEGEIETCMDEALIQIVDRFIRRNFIDLYERDAMYKLSVEDLEAFVKKDDLNIPEEELLYFVLNYMEFHQLNAEKANQLLANVRVVLIDPIQLQKIADENQTLRKEMETKEEVNLPRYPRDIILVTGDWLEDGESNNFEIFNIRKNEWKPAQMNGISPDIILGNILYEFEFLDGGLTNVRSFDVKNGHLVTEKQSQLPNDLDLDFDDNDFNFLAWNRGILVSMSSDSSFRAAYYNIDENSWVSFPARLYATCVVVNGNLFSIGGKDEVDENGEEHFMSKIIAYLDTETMDWILCGHLKKNSESLTVQVVDGKVYVFYLDEKYAKCFQPVWEHGSMHLNWFPNIQLPWNISYPKISSLDNKILFTGGIQWGKEDLGRSECYIFSPRMGEWSQAAKLHSGKLGHKAITINTSDFEVDRIQQLCDGQVVVSDEDQ